jgi:LPXTG-motif cell wall-anchored protein
VLGSTGYTGPEADMGLVVVAGLLALLALALVLFYRLRAKPLTCSSVEMAPKMFEKPLLRVVPEAPPLELLLPLAYCASVGAGLVSPAGPSLAVGLEELGRSSPSS